ncbi:large conductance mechanosensitive channel protein MscL [Jatrophihabitans sp.]|uniref:large conductance mechanosensitive channel protein MscL n=1 Tax=Jatrophihabitans sp. TaxID=1932789 RepID=UPI0030C760EF|nr:large conductance mechanosensitive channel protein [Jatrophihabitans sp.]
MLKGFKEFIMRGNVIDLAVAVVVGAAFKSVVDAFVANIITPLIAAIAGKPDFSKLAWHWHKSVFQYGAFLNTVVSFLLVASAIYFAVVAPLNVLAERRARKLASGVPDDEPKPEDIVLLEQIRDLLKAQQQG